MRDFKHLADEVNGHRLKNFWHFLKSSKIDYGVQHVFYEKPGSFQGRGYANQVVPHLVGVLELWAALNDIPIEPVSPSTLKKFATGRGNKVSKKEMMEAARQLWVGVHVHDDNQADALILLRYAMHLYDYQPTKSIDAHPAPIVR